MTEQETEAKLKALNKRLARLQAQKHRDADIRTVNAPSEDEARASLYAL